ncbi:hypothetical protein [Rubripirellula reticaptiva]|uniref:Uncharacterized protein n=1 Tax=Rubripirellula reticaptiva TaxID=2528013 RepID=A0A5C6EQ35_9BACT|nr:hypothetical protein [Rubripirellula reticaptiva]TWU51232.1 hypothetical protein Poly59_28240 [Rubripirellula reticaptiva]
MADQSSSNPNRLQRTVQIELGELLDHVIQVDRSSHLLRRGRELILHGREIARKPSCRIDGDPASEPNLVGHAIRSRSFDVKEADVAVVVAVLNVKWTAKLIVSDLDSSLSAKITMPTRLHNGWYRT